MKDKIVKPDPGYGFRSLAEDTLEELGLVSTPKRMLALFNLIQDSLEAVARKDALKQKKLSKVRPQGYEHPISCLCGICSRGER